jgi:UDP-N-acetylmuramate--alanine ligase
MSGIAELLVNLGYEVTGSDARQSELTERLQKLGVRVWAGHDASHVGATDVVVVSSAIGADNAEVAEARRRSIPVIPRAEMLAELMRLRYGIAIAGAHGKTTTTSMVALILERAGLDPTAVIGGRLSAFGSNARLGRGDYMVVEADESDRSFLKLSPSIAVITNIDREHMENYGDWSALQQAFADFANKVPFYGAIVACGDDGPVRELLPKLTRRVIRYGLEQGADVEARAMRLEAFGASCDVLQRSRDGSMKAMGTLRLRVPGKHNVLNALGAVAVGLEAGVPFARIAAALEEFRGAERRFQMRGEEKGVMVVDDYGHHPTEITAVISAARAGIDRRVVVVFQPHRYSRTRELIREFGTALNAADEIVLTDIYSAGEQPIHGVTIEGLADAIRAAGPVPLHVVKAVDDLPRAVAGIVRRGDLVITLGAGSIGTVGDRILAELRPAKSRAKDSDLSAGARTEGEAKAEGPADLSAGARAEGEAKAEGPADLSAGARTEGEAKAEGPADLSAGARTEGEAKAEGPADLSAGARAEGEGEGG